MGKHAGTRTARRWIRPGADRELALLVLRFVLAELPVLIAGVLFWLSLFARVSDIGVAMQVILVVALALAVFGAVVLARDQWRHLQRAWLQRRVANVLAPRTPMSADTVREWQAAVPSASDLRAVDALCAKAAADWASDGVVTRITYYIGSFLEPLRVHVQPHAYSRVRSETCDLNVGPNAGPADGIESVEAPPEIVDSLVDWPYWREAWLTAIEASARILDRAESAQLQIFILPNAIHFTAHADSGNRHEQLCTILDREGNLARKGGRVIRSFGAVAED